MTPWLIDRSSVADVRGRGGNRGCLIVGGWHPGWQMYGDEEPTVAHNAMKSFEVKARVSAGSRMSKGSSSSKAKSAYARPSPQPLNPEMYCNSLARSQCGVALLATDGGVTIPLVWGRWCDSASGVGAGRRVRPRARGSRQALGLPTGTTRSASPESRLLPRSHGRCLSACCACLHLERVSRLERHDLPDPLAHVLPGV